MVVAARRSHTVHDPRHLRQSRTFLLTPADLILAVCAVAATWELHDGTGLARIRDHQQLGDRTDDLGLIAFGVGQGALVTLVFNVLVSASPKALAGDVGSVRGTTQNLASAVGTAVAGAVLVGVLSAYVVSGPREQPPDP